MKWFSLLFAALLFSAITFTSSDAARWPTDNWSQTCGFWVHCAADRHTGVDGYAPYKTQIFAPLSGVLREVTYHGGYGGTIIIECRGQGETVTILLGHMDGDHFAVPKGKTALGAKLGAVTEGQYLGYTALSASYWSGGYDAHSHEGIHKGAYVYNAGACGGGWNYLGYAQSDCERSNWYDPNVWIRFTNAFNRVGGESKLGHPVTDFSIPAGYWQREYDGGSFGRCMLVWNGNPTQIYLIRTGFYQKYVSMNATKSWLGPPTGDEYVYLCTATCNLSRQNFKNGYMIWDCSGEVKTYANNGARVYGLEPVIGEAPMTMPSLSLAISPNPTRVSPNIRFSLPQAGEVSLSVYDVAGRKITTLVSGQQSAGEQTVVWNRLADDGTRIRSGLYFVRLVTPSQSLTRQIVTIE